jgi:hypothetical protein
MTQKMSFLDNISEKDNITLNKNVLDTIKMMLLNPSSTSKSSNIRDKNDFQNFNRKKFIEIIKSNLFNIAEFLKQQNMSRLQLIQQIETGTLLPRNHWDKPIFQKILSNYYMLRMYADLEQITNFNQAKNSSQFKIQESDKKFFNNIKKTGQPHIFGEYNNYTFGNYFSKKSIKKYTDNSDFILDWTESHLWTHHRIMKILLILKHVNFPNIIEEMLFNKHETLSYKIINEHRGEMLGWFEMCPVENLSLFAEKMINKTHLKIMRKNGINEDLRTPFTTPDPRPPSDDDS